MAVTREQVEELYVATFNRASDAEGLDYWVNSGLNIEEIAASFFDSEEVEAKYPLNQSNEDFVQEIYQNVFNRDGEEEGVDYWTDALTNSNVAKDQMIMAMINGAQGIDNSILENKTEAGLEFANAGLNNINEAMLVMEGITNDDATVINAHDMVMGFISDRNTDAEGTLAYTTGNQDNGENGENDNSTDDTDIGYVDHFMM